MRLTISRTVNAFLLFAVAALAAGPAVSQEQTVNEQQVLVDKAVTTFNNFSRDPEMTWFQQNIGRAKAVMVVPNMIKGGFILGGAGGSGVLVVRDEKTGEWFGPAFYTLGSGSIGLQAGIQASEVVLLIFSEKAVDSMLSTSFKLGGDAAVAAGPVGVGAADHITAHIVSFMRSKGVFAGVSLDGAVMKTKDAWNQAYYGSPVSPADILVRHTVRNPGGAALRGEVSRVGK